MSFGPIISTKTSTGLQIELAPFTREEVVQFVDGLQTASVTRFVGLPAMTSELEQEWYDKKIKEVNSILWGVWTIENDKRVLVGSTAINDIGPHVPTQRNITQGTTAIVLTCRGYWGKGIASAAHSARTWYAFRQHGLVRLKSAVAQTNHASRRALEKVGYSHIFTERNFQFIDGQYVHEDNFECLNPDDWAWRLWWGGDRPTKKAVEARVKTIEVLSLAEKKVKLL